MNDGIIRVDDVNKIFLISDTHFGHEKIIQYANRPFESLGAMDETMIERWNERVREHDKVIHLGDFCFGNIRRAEYYFGKLNGKISILKLRWHHDYSWLKDLYDQPLLSASGYPVILLDPVAVILMPKGWNQVNGHARSMFLSHNATYNWHHKHFLSWHGYGHSHEPVQQIPGGSLAINLNVEAPYMDYGPISVAQIGMRLVRIQERLGLKPIGAANSNEDTVNAIY